MHINLIDEYNEKGHLIHIENFIGAFVRGKTFDDAMSKLGTEITQYCLWLGKKTSVESINYNIIKHYTELAVEDADSDIIFESETLPLTYEEYDALKSLALKSASDFYMLYQSIPNKHDTVLTKRKTFYGEIPVTADEMYIHTKNVNAYYFGEINIDAENAPDIFTCRKKAFSKLELRPDFLRNPVFDGSYGEQWSLRKLLRRFIWHDRIHARAMYKMAVRLCEKECIANPFYSSG